MATATTTRKASKAPSKSVKARKATTPRKAATVTQTAEKVRPSFTPAGLTKQTEPLIATRVELPEWLCEALVDSFAKDAGYYTYTVESEQDAKRFESLIRRCASSLPGMGSRVDRRDNGDGSVTVAFKGQEKSNRPGRAGNKA